MNKQSIFTRPHHQQVAQALQQFNVAYLNEHTILFGGGTRIALELDEFRESVDIDFLCRDSASYRAVRRQVTSHSLGDLVTQDFDYPREIRVDRDAVRCFIRMQDTLIKLEFVAFADYELSKDSHSFFGVPMIDKTSCFITKLLANADRYRDFPYKDIFDLLMMVSKWDAVPQRAWQVADKIYSEKLVKNHLIKALQNVIDTPEKYRQIAVNNLAIDKEIADPLIDIMAKRWLDDL